MQLLRAIETKFWYLWVGIALFVAFGIALQLVPIYITGEHILAIHARVGYGVFYVDMLAPMLISCFVVLPLLVFIKREPTPIEALLTSLPVGLLHAWVLISDGPTPAQIQSVLINLLLVYLAARLVIPRFTVKFSVLRTACSKRIYPLLLFGLMICLPAAVLFFYGKIMNSPKIHISYVATGVASIILLATKLRGGKILEKFSLIVVALLVLSLFLLVNFLFNGVDLS